MIQENEKLLKERVEEYAREMADLVEDYEADDILGLSLADMQIDLHTVFGKVPLELRGAVYLEFIEELKLRLIPFNNELAVLEVA